MPSVPVSSAAANLNLSRQTLPGVLTVMLLTPLRPVLHLLRLSRRPPPPDAPAVVFASYMVGDLFMALPALKTLAASTPIRILCRPDCVPILRQEGLDALPFDNAFFSRRTAATFIRTARAAWVLRNLQGARRAFAPVVYDVDANPVTALWMRLAGAPRVVSYRRAFGMLFDETFPLPAGATHQADRDLAVAEHMRDELGRQAMNAGRRDAPSRPHDTRAQAEQNSTRMRERSGRPVNAPDPLAPASPEPSASATLWLLSVWTRKAAKNWPLEHWDLLLQQLLDQGVECAVLLAPDGDEAFAQFRARWEGRVGFVSGSLGQIADTVRTVAGVIATDNFLGHMAGYYGKPVVWINMVSPAAQVMPRGPRTIEVAPERVGPGEAAGAAGMAIVTVEAVRRAFDAARAPG